jgi:hypothetical protein
MAQITAVGRRAGMKKTRPTATAAWILEHLTSGQPFNSRISAKAAM